VIFPKVPALPGNKGEIISLNKKNRIISDEFMKKTKVGHYPPMRLRFRKRKNFLTKKKAKKRLEVRRARRFWNDDDMMGLTNRCISEEDLSICPFTPTNIARYINVPSSLYKILLVF